LPSSGGKVVGANPWSLSGFANYDFVIATFIINRGAGMYIHPGNYQYQGSGCGGWAIPSHCNWQHDKISHKYSYEFYIDNDNEEHSPNVLYDDDETFWTTVNAGSGSVQASLAEETATVKKGTSSLKVSAVSGTYAHIGCMHDFGANQDWSGYDFICLYIYGNNTGITIQVVLTTPDNSNYAYWSITDNWTGWKRLVLPLRKPTGTAGTYSLSSVRSVRVWFNNAPLNTSWYIDRMLIDVGKWVHVETFIPDNVKNVKVYSWDGSAYQLCLDGGLPSPDKLYLLNGYKLSDISRDGLGISLTGLKTEQVKFENALSFDGIDDYLSGASAIPISSEFSVSVWFKRNGNPKGSGDNNYHTIIQGITGYSTYPRLLVSADGTVILLQLINASGAVVNITVSNSPLSDNQFHHIGVSFNGSNVMIYVDGVLKGWGACAGVKTGTTPYVIGQCSSGVFQANGIIDDVRVYDRALSEAEVKQLYQRRFDPSIPDIRYGLVLDLPLNGDTLDYSGYNNNGTNYGAVFVAPTSGQMSSYCGVKKRKLLAVKMPPDDGQDSSTYGISQCKLKIEVYYGKGDSGFWGEATYEFENSTNLYYGLRNINKPYIALWHNTEKRANFIILPNTTVGDGLPNRLEVTADENQDIVKVVIGWASQKTADLKYGLDLTDPTLDSDGDGIPDVIENIESYVGGLS